jgi:hypothetical protein
VNINVPNVFLHIKIYNLRRHQTRVVFTSNLSNRFLKFRFDVSTAVTMKNAVFWDVALCRCCVNRYFGGTYRLRLRGRKICERGTNVTCSRWFLAPGFIYPEDGGDTFLRNVGSHKIYTAPHPRRRHSSNFKMFMHSHYIDCCE